MLHRGPRFSTIPDPDPEETELYAQQLSAPAFVHPVSVGQLETMVRRPTLPRLVGSAAFLKSQLPARLSNHVARLAALPPSPTAPLQSLLDSTVDSKRSGLRVAQDWRLVPTGACSRGATPAPAAPAPHARAAGRTPPPLLGRR